jgi:hypothetical protein
VRTDSFAGALVGLVLSACGSRTDLLESPGRTDDAGALLDAAASQDALGTPDPTATSGADGFADSGADATGGAACMIPPLAFSVGAQSPMPPYGSSGTCIAVTQNVPPDVARQCGSTQYVMQCAASRSFKEPHPDVSLSCDGEPIAGADDSTFYCCPCAVVGVGCVNVDLSTYDRSCSSDADCAAIRSGVICPGACVCANAVISAKDESRYWQTLAGLPPASLPTCGCPNEPRTACIHGVCTYGQ